MAVEPDPDPHPLAESPCLGIASPGGVGKITVHDFRDMPDAPPVDPVHGA